MKIRKLIVFITLVLISSMILGNVYAENDTTKVIDIRQTSSCGKWISDIDATLKSYSDPYEEGEAVYVIDKVMVGNDNYLKCLTDHGVRYILQDLTEPCETDMLLSSALRKNSRVEIKKTAKSKTKSRSGKHSRKVRITCYCKACNGNWGTQTASGVRAYVGGCAIQGVPFGTIVHTSYGDFKVIDRPGGSRVLDIYIGDYEKCHCSSAGYYGWETVTW